MTKEHKELLFKELSARLPYRVKCEALNTQFVLTNISKYGTNDLNWKIPLDEIKPYLRPMSSMIDEERKELRGMTIMRPDFLYGMALFRESYKDGQYVDDWDCCSFKILDWLNAHHFDYRGLIKRGLALEATEDMYNLA